MTQVELAQKIQSSQPLIAQAENGDASVSIELLIRGMLGTGATLQEIGKVIAEAGLTWRCPRNSNHCPVFNFSQIWIACRDDPSFVNISGGAKDSHLYSINYTTYFNCRVRQVSFLNDY